MPKAKIKATYFKERQKEHSGKYKQWVHGILSQNPTLDYVVFANLVNTIKSMTNTKYGSLLRYVQKNGNRDQKAIATSATNIFNSRNNVNSSFHATCTDYWRDRLLAFDESLQEDVQETTRVLSSSILQHITTQAQVALSEQHSVAAPIISNAAPTTVSINQQLNDQLHEIESNCLKEFNIFDLCDKEVRALIRSQIGKHAYTALVESYLLKPFVLSGPGQLLYDYVIKSTGVLTVPKLNMVNSFQNIEYCKISHDDWSIIHALTSHFIRLIESPKSPLLSSTNERTVATYSCFPITNNLFVMYTDVLNIKWLEVSDTSMQTTKFDALGLASNDDNVPIFAIELAGGTEAPTSKLISDTMKLYFNSKEGLKSSYSKNSLCKRIFTVLFHNNTFFFESLNLYQDKTYVRVRHVTINNPTSYDGLRVFVKTLPKLFSWRDEVVRESNEFAKYNNNSSSASSTSSNPPSSGSGQSMEV